MFLVILSVDARAAVSDTYPAENICPDGIQQPPEEITEWLKHRESLYGKEEKINKPFYSREFAVERSNTIYQPQGAIPKAFFYTPCTDYTGANLRFLTAIKPLFTGSSFENARFEGVFIGEGHFEKARFLRAILSGAEITNSNFDEADMIEVSLDGALIRGSNFRSATLNGAKMINTEANFAKFSNADLSGADITNSNLEDTDLTNANLGAAILDNAKLFDANATGANFYVNSLKNANLSGTLLINAMIGNLKGAMLNHTNISYACLSRHIDFMELKPADVAQLVGMETVFFDPINDCSALISISKKDSRVSIAPWSIVSATGRSKYNPAPIIPVSDPNTEFHAPSGFLEMAKQLSQARYDNVAQQMLYAYRHNEERFLKYDMARQWNINHYEVAMASAIKYIGYAIVRTTTDWGVTYTGTVRCYLFTMVIGWLAYLGALFRQRRGEKVLIWTIRDNRLLPSSRFETTPALIARALWVSIVNSFRCFWKKPDEKTFLTQLHPHHPIFRLEGWVGSFAAFQALICNYFLISMIIVRYAFLL